MPGRHHADNRPSLWHIIAIIIILAGLLAAGILLVRGQIPGQAVCQRTEARLKVLL